jgi:hypothetical protein
MYAASSGKSLTRAATWHVCSAFGLRYAPMTLGDA